jgi:hypothetical protein
MSRNQHIIYTLLLFVTLLGSGCAGRSEAVLDPPSAEPSEIEVYHEESSMQSSQESYSRTTEGGVLERRTSANMEFIYVNLDGAVTYETGEAFGKIVNTATGVVAAKRYGSEVVPGNPQASYVKWRVQIAETDPFRLQANIMTMINTVLDHGGSVTIRGIPYRYTPAEVDMLRGIRISSSNPKVLQFIVDRERMRDADFSGRHDPYNPSQ